MDVEPSPDEHDRERRATAYEYDFLKQLTTFALAGLGGVVTLAGSVFAAVPDKGKLLVSAGLFGVMALAAFGGQSMVVRAVRRGRTAARSTSWTITAASLALGGAIGVLLDFAEGVYGFELPF